MDLGEPIWLFGAGKAAPQMACAVENVADVRGGLIVAKRGLVGCRPRQVEVVEAGHPHPDRSGAGEQMISRLRQAHGRVLFVLSGGASSLLCAPVDGLSIEQLGEVTRRLLAGGVAVDKINLVRRLLSRCGGGGLAAVCAAQIDVLVISDVLSNALWAIGSGPFVSADARVDEALAVAEAVGLDGAVLEALRVQRDEVRAAPVAAVTHHLVASHEMLLDAATGAARGHAVHRVAPSEEDVVQLADRYAAMMTSDALTGTWRGASLLVSGGEPTVTLPERAGRGGRNLQLALLMAQRLEGRAGEFLSIASDGDDGSSGAAGACVDGGSWTRMCRAGVEPALALVAADAYTALHAIGAVIETGPTATNVLDLHLMRDLRD